MASLPPPGTPPQKKLPLYLPATLLLSLGGFLNGYDTGSIGALTSMTQFERAIGTLSPFQLGFTVSLIMLAGFFPCFVTGSLSDRYGRLRVVSLGASLFTVGAVIEAASGSLSGLCVGRALAGLGEGVYLGIMSVYICEIAPASRRGPISSFPQLMTNLGICLGYFTCYGSVHISSSLSWRLPFIIQAVLGCVFASSCFYLPDSPRWLMLHGRRQQALKSIQRLQFNAVEAEELLRAPASGAEAVVIALGPWQSFRLCFRGNYRYRTVLALFILGMVQLSGIDGVLYYAPTLFAQAGLSSATSTFLASGLSSILMLLITIPAFLLLDKWGRRTNAITGGLMLSAIMTLIGCLYAANAVHPDGVGRWVVIVSVFLFGLTFCSTWGVVGKVYASEIQPTNTRAAANTLAQGLGFLTNWFVAMITPILLSKSAYGAYFLFGGLALATVLVLAYMMPETKGRSLETIQEAFQKPGSNFIQGLAVVLKRWAGISQPSSRPVSASSSDGQRDTGLHDSSDIELVSMAAFARDTMPSSTSSGSQKLAMNSRVEITSL